MSDTYKIVRFFKGSTKARRVICSGLTLEQAQAHCRDPETSSSTGVRPLSKQRTRAHGAWFDGYEKEK